MNSVAALWRVSVTSSSASAGNPALTTPERSASAIAILDWSAADEPRRNAALADFRHSPNASDVTFGRLS